MDKISLERVKKVWKGERVQKGILVKFVICSKCGTNFEEYFGDYPFCPRCGATMMKKAVDMVMERLEAMYEKD